MLSNLTKQKINSIEFGQSCFYIGTILLSSAPFFSGIFYLFSLIISFSKKNKILIKDRWNISLFICSIILIFSSISIFINQNTSSVYEILKKYSWNPSSIWLNLFNWLPLFLVFSCFQLYLRHQNQRERFAKCIFIGIFPVIISFLLQSLKIYGPFKYLNGLVVFYLKPVDNLGGLAGLFNNPNYAGIWLSASIPFCFWLIKKYKYKKLKLSFMATILISTIFCILTTNSRNSFVGIIIASSLMLSKKFIFISLLILGIIYFLTLQLINIPFLDKMGLYELFPDRIFKKLLQTNYFSKLQFSRIDIWGKAINLILERPLLGWGAATFPILYKLGKGLENAQHTHNMPIEIAQTNGIPASLILTFFVYLLFFKAWKIIFIKNKNCQSIINKAWITSFIILTVSHLSDVTYYDMRISLLIWILLAGLKCILDEDKIQNEINKVA